MKALRNTTVRLATDNKTLESDAKDQVKKQKEYGQDFTRIGQQQDAIMQKHGTILGMDENSALEMLSSNYQMILWDHGWPGRCNCMYWSLKTAILIGLYFLITYYTNGASYRLG